MAIETDPNLAKAQSAKPDLLLTQNGSASGHAPDEAADDEAADAVLDNYDPITGILSAFDSIPAKYLDTMFADVQAACVSKDLAQLKEAIASWAATTEIYANPKLLQPQITSRDRRGAARAYGGCRLVAGPVEGSASPTPSPLKPLIQLPESVPDGWKEASYGE